MLETQSKERERERERERESSQPASQPPTHPPTRGYDDDDFEDYDDDEFEDEDAEAEENHAVERRSSRATTVPASNTRNSWHSSDMQAYMSKPGEGAILRSAPNPRRSKRIGICAA